MNKYELCELENILRGTNKFDEYELFELMQGISEELED